MTLRYSSRAGITLIEILIAVSLLSLLSVGMLMAMRVGFNTMEKTDAHLVRNRRVSNSRKIIESEIAGFVFTRAYYRAQPESPYQSVPFTQWEAHSMRFVTAYSLQDGWRGRAQIAALQVIAGDRGEGVRLIVNETPYAGPLQAGQFVVSSGTESVHFAPVVPGPESFVLADRLSYCRFSYQSLSLEEPFRVWIPDWDQHVLPLGIRIEMAPLDTGPADLHVTSITMPLLVNRDIGVNYADVP